MAKKRRAPEASAEELGYAAAFRTELRRFLHATEAVTSREELTPERYDLLLMIKAAAAAGKPSTVTSLCEMLDLRQQAVTELVKRAIDAGIIAREQSGQDGRVFYLRLAPDGDDRLMRAFKTLGDDRAAFAAAFDRLDLRFRALAADQPQS